VSAEPAERPLPLLVLGLGNILCSDDGVGVVAVEELRRCYELPEGVTALDGGTLGLALLPHLCEAKAAILLDAVASTAPPGSLVRVRGEDVGAAVATRLSVHQVGVGDLLSAAALQGGLPAELVLLGVVPGTLAVGVELTNEVARAVPELVREAVREAGRLGFSLAALGPTGSAS
jgi:hydrogenase maturation protease